MWRGENELEVRGGYGLLNPIMSDTFSLARQYHLTKQHHLQVASVQIQELMKDYFHSNHPIRRHINKLNRCRKIIWYNSVIVPNKCPAQIWFRRRIHQHELYKSVTQRYILTIYIYGKSIAIILVNWKSMIAFSLKLGTNQECLLSQMLSKHNGRNFSWNN